MRRISEHPQPDPRKNPLTNKLSLKQPTEKSTTCYSIYNSTHNKQSIRNLMAETRFRNHQSENLISTSYEDIRVPIPAKKENFFTSFFCSSREESEELSCKCGEQCPWMLHWLSLSMKSLGCGSGKFYALSRETDEQIKKDLKRTQPNSRAFQTEQYQGCLYECLVAYARLDPQVAYVQGMNILCSVLLYHSLNVGECVQVLKFFMMSCGFRQAYLQQFEFAYRLCERMLEAMKYRCSDLYRHIVQKTGIDLSMFVLGWILPMMGNIIPIELMHMVMNTFIERRWEGLLRIMMTLLLYLKPTLMHLHDETELMEVLSVQGLRKRALPWEEIIMSSSNLKTGNYLNMDTR